MKKTKKLDTKVFDKAVLFLERRNDWSCNLLLRLLHFDKSRAEYKLYQAVFEFQKQGEAEKMFGIKNHTLPHSPYLPEEQTKTERIIALTLTKLLIEDGFTLKDFE